MKLYEVDAVTGFDVYYFVCIGAEGKYSNY